MDYSYIMSEAKQKPFLRPVSGNVTFANPSPVRK